jgi:ABC-type multidrug transport system permease subunit
MDLQQKNEILWKQYQQNVDLYKFYMELVIKFNIFYYAVTGGIISFYFANNTIPNIKYSLLLPILMSICFAGFFIYGAILMKHLRREVFEIRDKLTLTVAPDVSVLSVLLYIFSAIYIIISISLGCLICSVK